VQALTVTAIVSFLREILEANEMFSDLWIVGEVSSFSRSQVGHRYFSLRDPGGVLRTVMFRDTMPGTLLKDGERVLAHGRLTLYTQRGDLQFVCDFVRPEGVGVMAARYEQLRLKLETEGLFAVSRKRPLPPFPLRVGLVTSPAGAALQDIKNVLTRRWPLATLVLAGAKVQGEDAPAEIAAALRELAREPGLDVAILARGGGSAEDLSAFNSEAVARALYGFPVPVVSGVGHETDETLADMVADLRAPTPSAAAERATPDINEVRRSVSIIERTMASGARHELGAAAHGIATEVQRLRRAAPNAPGLAAGVRHAVAAMESDMERQLAASRAGFEGTSALIETLNPHATLRRGFAIVQQAKSRKVVDSVRKVRPGDRLTVGVADGAFWTEVS
jgi:exodeoxyribonuclease VII large subunit